MTMLGDMRLREHRKSFLEAEVPMTGPLLRTSDLEAAEVRTIEKEIVSLLLDRSYSPEMYLSVLHSWGIICPHPKQSRIFHEMECDEDTNPSFEECPYYICSVCNCIVINRE